VEVEGVLGLLTVCFGVSAPGFLWADDDGRDVGVLDLKFVRDVGLDGVWAEVDVLRSLTSACNGVPLVNEDGGGGLPVVLALGFVGVALSVFGGDLVATEDGPGLVVGEVIVG
jgi:hypothetical protein